jgi:hypothetical protein
MDENDASYRLLFNDPHMVRSLFQGIIGGPWLNSLKWHRLRALPSDYVSRELHKRQGDRVWRVPRSDGRDLYMLLMLEHQSTNDRCMALRVATYCGLLYESLSQRGLVRRGTRFPAVLPVVLYSGVRRWTAAASTADLIDVVPPELDPYILRMRYLLVDEGALVRVGTLPDDNFAALLFRLEHNRGIEDVRELMQTIWNCTGGPEHVELRRAFVSWTCHVLLPRALPDVAVPKVSGLLEIKTMLTDHSRSWTHQWKMEGRKQGRKQGRKEGESMLLQRQLSRKFGPISADVLARLQGASSGELETWALNLLDADTLDDVFAGR